MVAVTAVTSFAAISQAAEEAEVGALLVWVEDLARCQNVIDKRPVELRRQAGRLGEQLVYTFAVRLRRAHLGAELLARLYELLPGALQPLEESLVLVEELRPLLTLELQPLGDSLRPRTTLSL